MNNLIKDIVAVKEGIIIAFKAIWANKMRSALTTLGIIIGIVAVTTMSTAIIGLENAFMDSISSLGSDVLYIDKFEWFGGKDWSFYRNRKDITYAQYEKLANGLNIHEAMAPNKRTFGRTVKQGELSTTTTMVYGTNQDYIKTSGLNLVEGRFFSEMEFHSARRVCVIGQEIKDALFPIRSPIGNKIKIGNVKLTVIGVLEKQGSGLFSQFSADGQLIMPLAVFEKAFGFRRGQLRIDVKVKPGIEMKDAKEEVVALMRQIRKVPPREANDFAVNQQEVFKDVYDNTVGVVALAGIVITALSLFVGAIGIMNIMFVSVTERTREIGIRKAIGARTVYILLQFLAEAIIICLIGGLIGLAISYPLSLIVNQIMPTYMSGKVVILALGISAIVGIISGFAPAYRASRMDPVDALRSE